MQKLNLIKDKATATVIAIVNVPANIAQFPAQVVEYQGDLYLTVGIEGDRGEGADYSNIMLIKSRLRTSCHER